MTERTVSPALRWQSLFFLFHYVFTLIVFSLPVRASSDVQALPELYSQQQPAPASSEADAARLRDQMAQFWGSAQHGGAGDSARSMAGGAVDSALTAEVESWLKMGGGKAKVTLDSGLSGNRSHDVGLDYFLPLMDWEKGTLFTQMSFHRWNDRNQFNLGLGYRHQLSEGWLAGSNLFYDRDLSRQHSRLGVGGELWGESLRTSVNYYHPLSDWRLSHDNNFNDNPLLYDLYERPARGWDVSVEAALSQRIGVKGTYFQWYGDKVDVTGARSQASRDPQGVTLGASWQPIPLLALNAEHSTITGQDDDTRLGLNLNWQFGRTLAQMLDPAHAAVLGSLKDARHDFVSRNNNIVLAYQQREKDLRLYFKPTALTVKAGSGAFTHAAKGGRGGYIVYHSSHPEVAQLLNAQDGTVAPLKRGEVIISAEEFQDVSRTNLYNRAEYRLTIQPGDFAPSVTDVRISGDAIIGNTLSGSYSFINNEGEDEGSSAQRWYHADAPEKVLSDSAQYQLTAADAGKTLVYEVTPVNKAGLRGTPGRAELTGPQLLLASLAIAAVTGGGEYLSNGQIRFKPGESGTLHFAATVLDHDGKPVPDQVVYWSHSNPALGKFEQAQQVTSSQGESRVKFSDITTDGEDIIMASLLPEAKAVRTQQGTGSTKTLPLSITFSPVTHVSFIETPSQGIAGADASFAVQVTDEDHLPIEKVTLNITSAGKTTEHITGKDGTARFSLTAPTHIDPPKWTIAAVLPGSNGLGDQVEIGLIGDIDSAHVSDLNAQPAIAVVGTEVQLLATVTDKYGNKVNYGQAMVSFLDSKAGSALGEPVATNAEGIAIFKYQQRSTGDFYPAARVGGGTALDTRVTYTADSVAMLDLQRNFTGDQPADGITSISWSVTATDIHGNPVPGAALAWKVAGPAGEIMPQKSDSTDENGKGQVTVTVPKTPGVLTVTVTSGAAQNDATVNLLPVPKLASFELDNPQPRVGSELILSARVIDLAGDPLPGVLVDFTNNRNEVMTEQSAVITGADGVATARVKIKSGKELGAPGRYDVSAVLQAYPSENQRQTVNWQADTASAQVKALQADSTTIITGESVALSATVQDQFGNPTANIEVEFLSAAHNGASLVKTVTNAQGVASFSGYTQMKEGTYYPAARVGSGTAQEVRVKFVADTVASLKLQRNFSDDVEADGISQVKWTVTAKDAQSNPAAGAALRWVVKGPNSNLSVQKDDETNAQGEGTLTLTLPEAHGDVTVEVTSGSGHDKDTVTLLPVMILASLKANNANPAVGSDVVMTARVTDQAGNPLQNVLVDFTNNYNIWMTEEAGVKSAANGEAVARLKIINGEESNAPGSYEVTAKLQKKNGEAKTTLVNWTADTASARVTNLTADPEQAGLGSKVTLTATVEDRFGNLVNQAQVTFLSSKTGSPLGSPVATNTQGEAFWDFQPTQAGEYRPAAQVGSSAAHDVLVTFWGRPSIDAVEVTPAGGVRVGETLTATLKGFNSNGTGQDASLYQWYSRPLGSSEWREIYHADQNSYTPDSQDIGFEVRVRVTPKGSEQVATGDPKSSDAVAVYGAPSIDSVSVTPNGAVQDGVTLTATIHGFNANGTGADASTYQWYYRWLPSGAPKPIRNADQPTFTPDFSFYGYEVWVVVTPKGSEQSLEGDPKSSDAVEVYGAPSITSVSVTPAGPASAGVSLNAKINGFVSNGSGTDASLYQWYSRPTGTTEWRRIDNAVWDFFPTNDDFIGHDLQVEVTPKGSDRDDKGVPKVSNAVSLYGKPTIESVSVTPAGPVDYGATLTATHQGFDGQGTGEDDSEYRWYGRLFGQEEWSELVAAAGQKTLTLQSHFRGRDVRAGVTPKGSTLQIPGLEVYSDPVAIHGTPSIDSVTISPEGSAQAGETLTARNYGFKGNGTGEDDSLYQWYSRRTGTSAWQRIDNATWRFFPTNDDYSGYDLQVEVTPKGSYQPTTGLKKVSNAVSIVSSRQR